MNYKVLFGVAAAGTALYLAPVGTVAAIGKGVGALVAQGGGIIELGGEKLVAAL